MLLPLATGLIYYRQLDRSFRLLTWFFSIAVLFEILSAVLKHFYHNNMPGLHFYTLVEYAAYVSVYYLYFRGHLPIRWFIGVCITILFMVFLLDIFSYAGLWNPNTLSRTCSSVSLILMALIFFYYLFYEDHDRQSWENPVFWFSTGVLVYFGLNIFYFMLNTYLIQNAFSIAHNSMRVHAGINILSHLLFTRSFLCFRPGHRK